MVPFEDTVSRSIRRPVPRELDAVERDPPLPVRVHSESTNDFTAGALYVIAEASRALVQGDAVRLESERRVPGLPALTQVAPAVRADVRRPMAVHGSMRGVAPFLEISNRGHPLH